MPRGKKELAEQIIPKLREVEVEVGRGKTVLEAVKKIGVTEQTYYRWKKQFGDSRGGRYSSHRRPGRFGGEGHASGLDQRGLGGRARCRGEFGGSVLIRTRSLRNANPQRRRRWPSRCQHAFLGVPVQPHRRHHGFVRRPPSKSSGTLRAVGPTGRP